VWYILAKKEKVNYKLLGTYHCRVCNLDLLCRTWLLKAVQDIANLLIREHILLHVLCI